VGDVNLDDAGFSLCECVERKIDGVQQALADAAREVVRRRRAVRR
jgi:hypothetical protein